MDRESALQKLTAILGQKKDSFAGSVQGKIDAYISRASIGECLTIVEKGSGGERRWAPQASVDYVRCLAAFCRNETLKGNDLDSALSQPVVDLVVKEFEALYEASASDVATILTDLLLGDAVFRKSLVETIIESSRSELPAVIKAKATALLIHRLEQSLQVNVGAAAAHAIGVAATKVVGAAVSLPIAHTTALLMAKLLALHLKVILAKVLASTAIKAMIATIIKKLVVAAIIGALMKLIGAKLGLTAGAAFMIVVVPLVLGFLAWETVHLPEKLGEKVSSKVASELRGTFDAVNRKILTEVIAQMQATALPALSARLLMEPELIGAIGQLLNEVSGRA